MEASRSRRQALFNDGRTAMTDTKGNTSILHRVLSRTAKSSTRTAHVVTCETQERIRGTKTCTPTRSITTGKWPEQQISLIYFNFSAGNATAFRGDSPLLL